MRLGSILVLLWLVVGLVASGQRGYFKGHNESCAKTGTILLTVIAGPLNYVGANPKVHDCKVPQPSK